MLNGGKERPIAKNHIFRPSLNLNFGERTIRPANNGINGNIIYKRHVNIQTFF